MNMGGVPSNGYTRLLLKMFCITFRGSVANNVWNGVLFGKRAGRPDLSKSIMVSIGLSYLTVIRDESRVDL